MRKHVSGPSHLRSKSLSLRVLTRNLLPES